MNNSTSIELVDIVVQTPLFQINPDSREILFGCIYSGLTFLVIPIYIWVSYVTLTNKELKSSPVNLFFVLTNTADFGQAFVTFLSGILVLFPNLITEYPKVVQILAATMNTFWLAMFPILIVFSYYRALVTYGKARGEGIPLHVMILLIFLLLLLGVLWMYCCVVGTLSFTGTSWMFDESKPLTLYISGLDLYVCLPVLAISNVLYLLIAIKVSLFRKMAGNKISFFSREWLIVGQVNFTSLYIAGVMVCWHNPQWFPVSYYTDFGNTLSGILLSHINLFLLFTFNGTIRQKCLNVLYKQTTKKSVSLFTVTRTANMRTISTIT